LARELNRGADQTFETQEGGGGMMKKLACSVVICTRNRSMEVFSLLERLRRQTRLPEQVVVVDGSDSPIGESPPAVEEVSAWLSRGTTLVIVHTEPGLTRQKNVGARLATADIVLFLDDDGTPDAETIERLMTVFENHPEFDGGMGTVEPAINRPLLNLFRRFFQLTHNFGSGRFLPSGLASFLHGRDRFASTEVLSGGFMALRKSILERHAFDEKLVGYSYMEDLDFSWRISREARLFFEPAAILHHPFKAPRGKVAGDRARMFVRHHGYLFFKNIFPGYPFRLAAFAWSILGYFILHSLRGDGHAIKGAFLGLVDVFRRWWRIEPSYQ
jgi:GT2 family glycosyltransferase